MFAPIVIWIRNWMGQPKFNHLRSKLIARHLQVITQVCDRCGVAIHIRQRLIHIAHDNGKKLGFLA
uniref:PGR5 protein involved in cyclic electron flow n=1 Tax=Cyanothece sp. (strain PCC 7425 / ATCC 29141) TaxID=395961 RepID=B8HZ46_CYAP4